MLRILISSFISVFCFGVVAEPNSVFWPARGTKVICGADLDGKPLKMHEVAKEAVLGADSDDGKLLVYFDLHKAQQLHLVFLDGMSDEQYNKREAALAKLSSEEADLIRKISANRKNEYYVGLTDGVVTFQTQTLGKKFGISCQETTIPGVPTAE